MPVSNADVVDCIGVDAATDTVCLSMFEGRDWSEPDAQLRDLERKVNSYIGFVADGELNENRDYRGKQIEFELYCQFILPQSVAPVFRALRARLLAQRIGFRVFIGMDRSCPLSL